MRSVTPIRVLFLCTGNSARSIIAEALLRSMGGDAFDVSSAGTHPKGLNPYTLQTLEQAQLDATGLSSKDVAQFTGSDFDYVITVCDNAAEECPVFPGAVRRLHWSFPDPAAVEGTDEERRAAFEGTLAGMRDIITYFIPIARQTIPEARA